MEINLKMFCIKSLSGALKYKNLAKPIRVEEEGIQEIGTAAEARSTVEVEAKREVEDPLRLIEESIEGKKEEAGAGPNQNKKPNNL